jgi:hypothetical protein
MALAKLEDRGYRHVDPRCRCVPVWIRGFDTQLIHVERYNPLQLPMMEDYLREQIEQGEQDFMANLAVLKL